MGSRRLVLTVVAVVAACGDERPEPPFVYRLDEALPAAGRAVLLEIEFESYSQARASGPYTVTLMRGGPQDVTLHVGLCASHNCLGPVSAETVGLSLDAVYADPARGDWQYVAGLHCAGLDGSFSSGIDVSGHGDCEP